jgi:hypothetical protein
LKSHGARASCLDNINGRLTWHYSARAFNYLPALVSVRILLDGAA